MTCSIQGLILFSLGVLTVEAALVFRGVLTFLLATR